MNRKIKWALKSVFSLAVLGVAFYFLDWESLRLTIVKVDVSVLIVCLALCLLLFGVIGFRWYEIIKGSVPLPLREHLVYYFYGTFVNTFSPSNLGGDLYRFFMLRPRAEKKSQVVVGLLRERLTGLIAYFVFYLACWAAMLCLVDRPGEAATIIFNSAAALILAATVGAVLVPIFAHRLLGLDFVSSKEWLSGILKAVQETFDFGSMGRLSAIWGLSFLGVAIWVLLIGILARHLGQDIPWVTLGAVATLVELVRMIPTSIQGIGVREGAFAYLYGLLGASPEAGFVLGAIAYLTNSLAIILCGLVAWSLGRFERAAGRDDGPGG